MRVAIRDLTHCFKSLPMALHFAWGDTKARYKRSVLGPFWIVLGTAIGVTGLGYLWSNVLKIDRATLIPSLTIGLVIWQLLASCITESSSVFIRNASIIRNIHTPFLMFPLQMVLKQLINFAHNAVVILVVLCFFSPPLNAAQWLVIPGLLLIIGNLLWISMVIGMLGARFRDIDPLISAVMPMLFFLSPVIFRPDHLSVPSNILWGNPLTYLITVLRDPLQGITPDWFVYEVVFGMLILGWAFALWLLDHRHHRIAFWV